MSIYGLTLATKSVSRFVQSRHRRHENARIHSHIARLSHADVTETDYREKLPDRNRGLPR